MKEGWRELFDLNQLEPRFQKWLVEAFFDDMDEATQDKLRQAFNEGHQCGLGDAA